MTPITPYSCNTNNQAENATYQQVIETLKSRKDRSTMRVIAKIIQPVAEMHHQKIADLLQIFPRDQSIHHAVPVALANAGQVTRSIKFLLDPKKLKPLDPLSRANTLSIILENLAEKPTDTEINRAIQQLRDKVSEENKDILSVAYSAASENLKTLNPRIATILNQINMK